MFSLVSPEKSSSVENSANLHSFLVSASQMIKRLRN
jgi:hypothetical protein